MSTERYVRLIAGTFVGLSLALGYVHSPYWHLFTAFVAVNLFQSALTGFCPVELLIRRLRGERGASALPAGREART